MSDLIHNSKASRMRTVVPPPPVGPGASNSVMSVNVAGDEDVSWTWTSRPNGTRFVSGYVIVKLRVPKAE